MSPPGGSGVCQGTLLLHGDHVCPLHYDSGRLLVCILDRSQIGKNIGLLNIALIVKKHFIPTSKLKTSCTFCCQAPARVTLGVSTLLALSTTLASIQKSLPPVAYMKVSPVLVVLAICQSFVTRPLMCGQGSACFSCSSP